jgi:hypothetical protein
VIAFQKNLVAAADAHHLMAEFIEARGRIAGAGEGEDGETEKAALHKAAKDLEWSRRHFLMARKIKFKINRATPGGQPMAAVNTFRI